MPQRKPYSPARLGTAHCTLQDPPGPPQAPGPPIPSLLLRHHLPGDLDSRGSDKSLCLIKTHCPTNWEVGNGWAVLQIETILVRYPLIEATKGSGKHPSETHSCNHQRGLGLGTHKSNSKCSNQERRRQRETKAQKHKCHRISPIKQLMWWGNKFSGSWPALLLASFYPFYFLDTRERGSRKETPRPPVNLAVVARMGSQNALGRGQKVVIQIPHVACL